MFIVGDLLIYHSTYLLYVHFDVHLYVIAVTDLIVCPSNEEMSPCGKQYEKNCTNAKWKRPPTTVRICGSHIQDCTCKEGHVRQAQQRLHASYNGRHRQAVQARRQNIGPHRTEINDV